MCRTGMKLSRGFTQAAQLLYLARIHEYLFIFDTRYQQGGLVARPRRIDQIERQAETGSSTDVVDLDVVRAARRDLPGPETALGMAALFGTLGDPTRLRIVAALDGREMCVSDIAAVTGLSTSAASHQLRVLRDNGLVRSRRDGRRIYYSLDDSHVVGLFRQAREHVAHLGE